jgi:hypothetical protein
VTAGALAWLVLEDVLSAMVDGSIAVDPMDTFMDEQRKMIRVEDAQAARNRKLTSIGSGEVFLAGSVILQEPGSTHRIKKDVIVAVTTDDLVVLNADVQRDPDGEIGRIHKAEVTRVRMLDEAGNPISMTQSRDLLELDEPEHSYVVGIDRQTGGSKASDAFVFRSLSVADEARRDFERNLANIA